MADMPSEPCATPEESAGEPAPGILRSALAYLGFLYCGCIPTLLVPFPIGIVAPMILPMAPLVAARGVTGFANDVPLGMDALVVVAFVAALGAVRKRAPVVHPVLAAVAFACGLIGCYREVPEILASV